MMLSTMTTSKATINAATKLMPYTPNFVVKKIVYPVYCGGETFDEVLNTGRKFLNRGIGNMMLSYSVEDADGTGSSKLLDEAVGKIKESIDNILVKQYDAAKQLYARGKIETAPASGYIALKPTGLTKSATLALQKWNDPANAQVWENYLDTCRDICRYARDRGEGKVVVVFDAEKTHLQQGVYAAQRKMMEEFNRNGNVIVAGTVQMYLQGSVDLIAHEIDLARTGGYQVAMKLVRGAYIHSEPDRWNVIHRTKEDTDLSYNAGVELMLDEVVRGWKEPNYTSPVGRVIVASHNADSCFIVDERMRREAPLSYDAIKDESVVFGQLMGMAEDQSAELARRGRKVVKYVPWGPIRETKEYLVRRLEENGDAAREGGWGLIRAGFGELARRAGLRN
jgi:proline dehydrogenase